MKQILKYSVLLLMALPFFSCSRIPDQVGGKGYLTVRMSQDVSITPVVKAEAGEPDPQFALEITSLSTGAVTTVEDYRTLSATPLELSTGRYKVRAYSGPDTPASWNSPRYEGETEILIKPEQVNEANITASLANTMVTVLFDERTADFFSEYRVTVSNENGDALVFSSNSGNLDSEAYFVATSLDWELRMVNTAGSVYRVGPVLIENVKARQHYQLRFTIQEEQVSKGAANIVVTVDDSVNEKDYNLVLDFDNAGLPNITGEGFEITGEISVQRKNAGDCIVNFSAPQGMKSLTISHSDASLLSAGLPQHSSLVEASASTLEALTTAGVTASSVAYGTQETSVNFGDFLSELELGNYSIGVSVVDIKNHYCDLTLNFRVASAVDAEATTATPWAQFAILRVKYYTDARPDGLSIQYRKATDSDWSTFDGSISLDETKSTLTAELYGLEASTAYVYRVISTKDADTREVSFTTAAAQDVPNINFDDWYQDGNAWYPGASSATRIWDTANGGTATVGKYPTTPETSDVVRGKAVRMESAKVLGLMAAGNIYIGDFVKVAGLGAELDWGYQYTSRPVALHGYYKYNPVAIDMAKDPYTGKKGEMDSNSIKIYLTDWTSKFRINTSNKVFLQDDDPSIIAMGDLTSNVTNSQYVEFTLPLQYRDNRTPSYIVIVGAASRLGDYFTGGVGSTLWIDEFSLIFDAGKLTEDERTLVGYRNL
ncbi:MAG: PCMD domain-containing protein [Bacteroidales bacterium]|nr:PCMD domain-containing protein [Bacteroidales bacterium]